MATLRDDDILSIAKLARIELGEVERKDMKTEVASILDFVDALQKIDTSKLEPTSQITGLKDVWREDKVVPSKIDQEVLLSQAPELQDGYVKVKKVL